MQGSERMDRQLTDVAALAGHLIPAGSMFAFLAEHRAEVFPAADYADLFAPPGSGRPSVPATEMAAVMTLHRFGQPAVSVVAGLLTLTIDPDGHLTSLSLHGHVLVDVCAALS